MSLSRKNMYLGTMHQASSGLRGIALKSVAGLVLGLGLWDCTSDDMAGGGPSGTEAGNAITATLYNDNGALARYATVTLIKRNSLSGEAYAYTAVADSNGVVAIDSVDVGDYIMEVALDGNAAQIEVSVENTKDTISLGEHALGLRLRRLRECIRHTQVLWPQPRHERDQRNVRHRRTSCR